MAKYRVRVSHKGKRWKKGHSSSSNPTANKHREAAKSRFFQVNLGESNLTKEAVEKHDAFNAKAKDEEMEEAETVCGKTFKTFETFASDWSSCSNASFSRLLKNFRSNSLMHKEMLAVLAAVTEVIKSNGGKETPTEYFAAFMTALEAEDSETSVLAILNLLGMCMKSVPHSVLQLKFPEISKFLTDILGKYAVSENFFILRPLLGCLSVLLRVQEAAAWNDSSTLKVLDSLMAFVTFSKPKIRKAAQHGVSAVIHGSNITAIALGHVAKHCIHLVEGVASGAVTTTLHVLSFLRDIMHLFPKKELKECCEAILKVMTMNNVLLSSCGMQALHGMFMGRPPATTLLPQRNAKMIIALYDYQPPAMDTQPTQAWLAVMQEAYLNMAKIDIGLCMVNLPRLFTTASELYLSERAECMASATHALEACIAECIAPAATPDSVAKHYFHIAKVMSVLQSRLSFQYHAAWTHVLHLMAAFFKACGATCSKCILPCLKGLAELRDSYQFAYVNELDNAVGCAIRTVGPQLVLQAIPLQISTDDKKRDFKRSWLLPVLKDNIKSSTLQFFTEYFLPLATTCRNESDRLKEVNDQIGALSYDLLQSQIWALLPSFSIQPPDITKSFPIIAKALGGVLSTRKDLRMNVMSSLRRLVTYAVDNDREEDKAIIGRYAKNYLPLLFNIYTTQTKGSDEEGTRLAAYETIKVFLKLSEESLCSELFKRAYTKTQEEEQIDFMKESVLDLLRALLPYQNLEEIGMLYKTISERIGATNDTKQQKKYYRLLEELCTSDSLACKEFIDTNLGEVKDLLLNSLSKAAANSKGARLRCLLELVKQCKNPDSLVESIVPEAILCVKDVNTKCRETAYKLLEAMADSKECSEYVQIVMTGLSGSQGMIAATLLALAAIVFHYKDSLPETVEESVLNNVGILGLSSSREVVGSALSFIKVYIQAFNRDKIARFIPNLMQLFSRMAPDCKRHSRTKTRDILARLVRWYGADSLLRLIPEKDNILKTRVRNLGKIQERKKKIREEQKQNKGDNSEDVFTVKGKPKSIEEILAESDSDIEYMEEEDDPKPTKKTKNKAWITEAADDIVDFTDTSATKKISASKPGAGKQESNKKKSKLKSDFKTAPDGRLIIADESDSEDETGNKKRKSIIPGFDENSDLEDDYVPSDGDEEKMDEEPQKKGRKRTLSISTTGTAGATAKYQAGGTGIHRPISKVLSKKSKKEQGQGGGSLGVVYKAKKGGGDMKCKGLPAPYAYLPLRKDALNRRKKMKNLGQFKNLVKGAKKGAQIGMKQKNRKRY